MLIFLLLLPAPLLADDKEVDPVRQKAAEKRFEKLKEYLSERRVSHVVELLAEWGEFADANQQDDVMLMAAAIRGEAEVKEVLKGGGPQVGYRGTSATARVKKLYSDASAYFVDEFVCDPADGREAGEHYPGKVLVVAARTLAARTQAPAEECVILTNAASAELYGLRDCFVISSGDVSVNQWVDGSLVVCRGGVRYWMREKESSLLKVGKGVTHIFAAELTAKKEPVPNPDSDRVFTTDQRLLGVKFYSAAEDGLEAKMNKKAVTVSKVDEKKPFAAAGVKVGDIIETINGEKVPSLHELDRLLCRASVASGVAKLKLKRGDAAEVIEVKLADW